MTVAIALHNPKNNINVGSALRAATAYEVDLVAISGNRVRVVAPTDTTKAHTKIPVMRGDDLHAMIPFGCVPVAVDLIPGAKCLYDYVHPKNAFYVFGAEDATLGEKVTSWCRDVIYIPTTCCMNLAATVNVILYDRAMKRRDRCGLGPVSHMPPVAVVEETPDVWPPEEWVAEHEQTLQELHQAAQP